MLMNFFLRLSKNLSTKALVIYLSKYGLLTCPPPNYQNQIAICTLILMSVWRGSGELSPMIKAQSRGFIFSSEHE